ncbi:hypothetical protein SAMN06264364_11819 [Quadrisphaera granulorum]|uniref:GH26 domain-containing protein n=1 Tax=Quadrisphaera granulorum TaxID=317664 RepID=A0A316A5Y7_9ACTN|nr:hypothetical protein [Quadrisphaera granulorum]PWJ52648.1 hypothetical protein BXY45_11819 [Quadrisphaera granulorum]SZE97470.1 hypothetical protein SAMN06264364_11819 [Quadrisphaera granulorum]
MPRHRQPTPAARRARPVVVTIGALTLLCSATGVALAATNPASDPAPTASTTSASDTTSEPTSTTTTTGAGTASPTEPTVPPAQASDGQTWLSGASGDGAADGALGKWRGDPVDIVGTWADQGDNQTQLYSIAPGGEVADFDGAIDIAPGGLQDGDTWTAAADGAYDDRWRESLTRMAELRQGRGTTYIRPFHEFNLGGWNWSVGPRDAEDFKAAWARYRAIQQEVFPEARLVYGVNVTSSGTDLDWRTTWPGAGQADVLGVDTYNGWPTITSDEEFQAQLDARGEDGIPIGLDAYREQAAEWGVPLAVPEWSGRAEMGDESAYVTGMVDWFAANAGDGPGQLVYEILFNAPQDDGNFQLFADDTRMPASAQAYVDAVASTEGDRTAEGSSSPSTEAAAEGEEPQSAVSMTGTATATTEPSPPTKGAATPASQAEVDELVARLDALLDRLEQS